MKIKELCKIARVGDKAKIDAFLSANKNLNLNETAEWFEPALETITNLVAKSEVPVPSMYLGPMTPLAVAATYGHLEVIKSLIETGKADVNAKSGRLKDHTPLDCAIKWCPENKKEDIIKYLLSKNAKREITTRESTALETLGEKLLKLLGEAPKVVAKVLLSKM
jgi:hypothetical protein